MSGRFDSRTARERQRDERELALSKSAKIDRLRIILDRARRAGLTRADLVDELGKLTGGKA